jgi:hypothetical protein
MATATGARVGAEATGAGDSGQARTMITGADGGLLQHPNPNPQTSQVLPQQPLPLNLLQNPAAFVNTNTTQNAPALPTGEATGQTNPPVSFQTLAQRNTADGQQDEIRRLQIRQEEMMRKVQAIKKLTESKEDEMRKLQPTWAKHETRTSAYARKTTVRQTRFVLLS